MFGFGRLKFEWTQRGPFEFDQAHGDITRFPMEIHYCALFYYKITVFLQQGPQLGFIRFGLGAPPIS